MYRQQMDKLTPHHVVQNQNLYSKNICVRLTNSKCEEKFKNIKISVDYQTQTIPQHKIELIIKLTDENDPFFLYSLYMSEEDYQQLKTQQGLLVDFSAFGQKFIDLLNLCEKDEKLDNPKFQLQLYTKEPLSYDHSNASLNVIEINPFKHLCHLQLNFMPGNDTDVKKYLANCLQTIRENYSKLNREYDEFKVNYTQRLEMCQTNLQQKTNELDKLRLDYDSQTERLNMKYMQELNFEKEKSIQTQYAIQQKFDKEKKDLEVNYQKVNKQMEQRLNELEVINKELTDKKYKNEVQLQELRSKLASLQEEYSIVKQDLNSIRKQNTNLDSELHTNEKTLNHLRTRIAVLEQEVKDKDELVQRSQDLLNNEQSQKKGQDELLNEKNSEIKKLNASVKHLSSELLKANEIIAKLNNKLRNCNNKIKLKNEILSQQEKVLIERDKEIAQTKAELKNLKENIENLSNENKDLKGHLNKKDTELDTAAQMIKKNEHMITWLNKQLTGTRISDTNVIDSNPLTYNGTQHQQQQPGQFRPIGSLVPTSQPLITPRNDFYPQTNGNLLRTASINKQFGSNEVIGEPQVRPYTAMSSTNSIDYSSRSSASAITPAPSNNSTVPSTTQLNPKYFQPLIDTSSSTKSRLTSTNTTTNSHSNGLDTSKVNSVGSNNNSASNAIRINKQLVVQQQPQTQSTSQQQQQQQGNSYAALLASKSTPSLASAYFPTN